MENIKKYIYDLAKRNVVFRKMSRFILKAYHKIKYIKYYFTIKTDDKVVIFETFNGRSFSDSPKYLYLEMFQLFLQSYPYQVLQHYILKHIDN